VNPSRRRLADGLYERSHAFDQRQADRLARFRNVEPATAELLSVLVRATGAGRILELGTSNGYSTIWLADAAERTGGRVLSVDTDPERTTLAQQNLDRAGLGECAELLTKDAATALSESGEGAWEFMFLDAERPAYPSYLADLVRTLSPGGMLAVDNVHSHAHELVEFTEMIESQTALTQTVLAVGAGLRLAVRER
jgi:predicted O-methyltransferase YrrM